MARKQGLRWLLVMSAAVGGACATDQDEQSGAVARAHMTFDEYVASLPLDEETGAYVVEGDILAYDRGDLTDYYAAYLYGTALTLNQVGSEVDSKYSAADALKLTYCVSDEFGAKKALVRDTFAAAAREWMEATKIAASDRATIQFTYDSDEDGDCTHDNDNVFFNISPSNSNRFDAASFFPHWKRVTRDLFITERAMKPTSRRTFQGVLRHEIGHMLGFLHEHVAEPAAQCNEGDSTWRSLTGYDVPSVMHYRDVTATCLNSAATDYVLTTHDNAGVRCLYTTQARAAADTAGDACRALTSFSPAAKQFVVNGHGVLYRLSETATSTHRTSTVARYVAPTTTSKQTWRSLWSTTELLSSPASELHAGGPELYRRTANDLYRWTGTTWASIRGGGGRSVVVAHGSGDLFRLNTEGTIDRVVAGQTTATPVLTTAGSGRRIYAGSHELYRVESSGDAHLWVGGAWSGRIGTGIRAVAETEFGATFCLLNDTAGTVMLRKSTGAWATIGSGARAIWGGLEVPYMSLKDNAATAADESTVIRRNAAGSTWHRYALNSTRIMKGGERRIAINANGRPYAYAAP